VGYWRFGEASGTTAADETGVNGGTFNNVLLGQVGALAGDNNSSASFDGSKSYVKVPSSSSLDMRSAVTVELWAKRRTISSTYQVLVGKPGDGQSKKENYAVWLGPSNRYTAYFGDGSNWVAVQTPVITDTNWHYVVADQRRVDDQDLPRRRPQASGLHNPEADAEHAAPQHRAREQQPVRLQRLARRSRPLPDCALGDDVAGPLQPGDRFAVATPIGSAGGSRYPDSCETSA
jgi:hypothetical protein